MTPVPLGQDFNANSRIPTGSFKIPANAKNIAQVKERMSQEIFGASYAKLADHDKKIVDTVNTVFNAFLSGKLAAKDAAKMILDAFPYISSPTNRSWRSFSLTAGGLTIVFRNGGLLSKDRATFVEAYDGKFYACSTGYTSGRVPNGLPFNDPEDAALFEDALKSGGSIDVTFKDGALQLLMEGRAVRMDIALFAKFKEVYGNTLRSKYGAKSIEYQSLAHLDLKKPGPGEKDPSFTVLGTPVKSVSLQEICKELRGIYNDTFSFDSINREGPLNMIQAYYYGQGSFWSNQDLLGLKPTDPARTVLEKKICELCYIHSVNSETTPARLFRLNRLLQGDLSAYGFDQETMKDPQLLDLTTDQLRKDLIWLMENCGVVYDYSEFAGAAKSGGLDLSPEKLVSLLSNMIEKFQQRNIDLLPMLAKAMQDGESSWSSLGNSTESIKQARQLLKTKYPSFQVMPDRSWKEIFKIIGDQIAKPWKDARQTEAFKKEHLAPNPKKYPQCRIIDAQGQAVPVSHFEYQLRKDLGTMEKALAKDRTGFIKQLIFDKHCLNIKPLTAAGVDTSNFNNLDVFNFYYMGPDGQSFPVPLIGGKGRAGWIFINPNTGRQYPPKYPPEKPLTREEVVRMFLADSGLEPGGQIGYLQRGKLVQAEVKYTDQTLDQVKSALMVGGTILALAAVIVSTVATEGSAAAIWAPILSTAATSLFLTNTTIEMSSIIKRLNRGEEVPPKEILMTAGMGALFFLGTLRSVGQLIAGLSRAELSMLNTALKGVMTAESGLNTLVNIDMVFQGIEAVIKKNPEQAAAILQNVAMLVFFHAAGRASAKFARNSAAYKESVNNYCKKFEEMAAQDSRYARLKGESNEMYFRRIAEKVIPVIEKEYKASIEKALRATNEDHVSEYGRSSLEQTGALSPHALTWSLENYALHFQEKASAAAQGGPPEPFRAIRFSLDNLGRYNTALGHDMTNTLLSKVRERVAARLGLDSTSLDFIRSGSDWVLVLKAAANTPDNFARVQEFLLAETEINVPGASTQARQKLPENAPELTLFDGTDNVHIQLSAVGLEISEMQFGHIAKAIQVLGMLRPSQLAASQPERTFAELHLTSTEMSRVGRSASFRLELGAPDPTLDFIFTLNASSLKGYKNAHDDYRARLLKQNESFSGIQKEVVAGLQQQMSLPDNNIAGSRIIDAYEFNNFYRDVGRRACFLTDGKSTLSTKLIMPIVDPAGRTLGAVEFTMEKSVNVGQFEASGRPLPNQNNRAFRPQEGTEWHRAIHNDNVAADLRMLHDLSRFDPVLKVLDASSGGRSGFFNEGIEPFLDRLNGLRPNELKKVAADPQADAEIRVAAHILAEDGFLMIRRGQGEEFSVLIRADDGSSLVVSYDLNKYSGFPLSFGEEVGNLYMERSCGLLAANFREGAQLLRQRNESFTEMNLYKAFEMAVDRVNLKVSLEPENSVLHHPINELNRPITDKNGGSVYFFKDALLGRWITFSASSPEECLALAKEAGIGMDPQWRNPKQLTRRTLLEDINNRKDIPQSAESYTPYDINQLLRYNPKASIRKDENGQLAGDTSGGLNQFFVMGLSLSGAITKARPGENMATLIRITDDHAEQVKRQTDSLPVESGIFMQATHVGIIPAQGPLSGRSE